MLENFIFENHLGQRFEGLENGVYLNYNDLRDYAWSYDTINSKISRFFRPITSRKIPLVVKCASDDEATQVKNRLLELAETDIEAKLPGRIYVGEFYTTGFITASKKNDYLISKQLCRIELTLTSDDPAWYMEKTYVFPKDGFDSNPGEDEPDDNEPGGIIPEGTLDIVANGYYDVAAYANVMVKIPVGIVPEGTLDIVENGHYDVSTCANVTVKIPVATAKVEDNILFVEMDVTANVKDNILVVE